MNKTNKLKRKLNSYSLQKASQHFRMKVNKKEQMVPVRPIGRPKRSKKTQIVTLKKVTD